MLRALTFALAAVHAAGLRHTGETRNGILLTPANTNLKHIAVVVNPGGGVRSNLYADHMEIWQKEAERAGFSMFVGILDYWFDIPLAIRLKANIRRSVSNMKSSGMDSDAEVYLAGHSMGGDVSQGVAKEFFEGGELSGLILLASYLNGENFPPMVDAFTYPVPTLTVGAELNYGAARITRIAAAAYRQHKAGLSEDKFPVVVVEGMNQMQYATGVKKEDLMPEKSDEDCQTEVGRVSVDWIKKQLGLGGGSTLSAEVRRTKSLLEPINEAFEYEGSKLFNVPNQKGAPESNCPRGVCADGSKWSVYAQEYILGSAVMATGVQVQDNYADLNPWSLEDREGRKPFITDDKSTAQTYVMASGSEREFEEDVKIPVSPDELLGKYTSRQAGALTLLGQTLEDDPDYCAEINEEAYKWALRTASDHARRRFEAHGIPMEFGATDYKGMGPAWVGSEIKYNEKASSLEVVSSGLFTEPGDRAARGNHYCKLLSPARALEYIYVDGLKRNLFKKWCGLSEC